VIVVNDADEERTIPVVLDPTALGMTVGEKPDYEAFYARLRRQLSEERNRITRRYQHHNREKLAPALEELEEKWSTIPMKPAFTMDKQTGQLELLVGIPPCSFRVICLELSDNTETK
jgi:hypothetical protein